MRIDGNPIWRQFKNKVEVLQRKAPGGYRLAGRLFMFGREEPLELGFVETSRTPGQTWTWLQAEGSVKAHEDEAQRMPHPDGEWIFLPESSIARVELHYVREVEDYEPIEIVEVEDSTSDPDLKAD